MTVKRVLFLSYNGALEPIFKSQGLPYLRRLAQKGIEIILLTFEKKEDCVRLGKSGMRRFREELAEGGIRWTWCRYHKFPPLLSTSMDLVTGFAVARRLAQRHAVEMIHARGTIPASIGWMISRLQKRPFLFDVRGFLAEEYADGGIWKRHGVMYRLVSALEQRFLKSADGVVVLTHRAAAYLKQKRATRDQVPVAVIPCCVDVRRFEEAGPARVSAVQEGVVLVYVGSLGTWYLLEPMLDFYRVLKTRIPNASFQILTQTGDRKLWERLRRHSGNGLIIRQSSYEDVPKTLLSAQAGISFIKPVFSKMASSPTKVGEYLAAGLPVVLNADVGDTEALIRENSVGVVVSDFSGESYQRAADALTALLREGKELSERCRRVAASQLSLEEGARRYHQMYLSLLEKS